mgnify:CR=1 FL=1
MNLLALSLWMSILSQDPVTVDPVSQEAKSTTSRLEALII